MGEPAGSVPDLRPAGAGPAPRLVEFPVSGPEALLHTGLTAATGDCLVLIEANGTMSPLEIPHYLHYLESGFDFVKASRFIGGGSPAGYPLLRRLGHRFLLAVALLLYGQRLTDLWYGFCAFRRGFVTLLDPSGDGMELDVEVVTHALHYGLRIAEVPSRELPRRDRTRHRHTLHEGVRILQALIAGRPRNALLRLVAASSKSS
ncbi:glycosyltransferase family 2 protein [Streptomyces sp. NPDC057136]|uniref:glycosyltransferase family 2 protein n=1 Tax=Streptomyces sp. NPDC057136 TaxID=3346029 RepID=UPI00363B6C6D